MIGKLLLLGAMTFGAACPHPGPTAPTPVAVATPDPVASAILPVGQGGRWALLFSDDFDGPSLDHRKWVTCYWWDRGGCTNLGNHELQWYQVGNVSVANGQLHLRAKRETVEGEGDSYEFTSGLISTGRSVAATSDAAKFDFQYGYAEMRARLPAGRGLLPAFWMLPSSHEPVPEIDIMEVLGDKPDTLYTHLHYRVFPGSKRHQQGVVKAPDLSAGWHVFAVDWRPDRIIWYLDGTECWRFEDADHIPTERMYLLINLAVGGKWPGPPDNSTHFPAELVVDYVRVWQRID
jgi:beta-glucanase (GH16 family)